MQPEIRDIASQRTESALVCGNVRNNLVVGGQDFPNSPDHHPLHSIEGGGSKDFRPIMCGE